MKIIFPHNLGRFIDGRCARAQLHRDIQRCRACNYIYISRKYERQPPRRGSSVRPRLAHICARLIARSYLKTINKFVRVICKRIAHERLMRAELQGRPRLSHTVADRASSPLKALNKFRACVSARLSGDYEFQKKENTGYKPHIWAGGKGTTRHSPSR